MALPQRPLHNGITQDRTGYVVGIDVPPPPVQQMVASIIGRPSSSMPLELYIWLVDKLTDDGATVLDPFMGSGTTGDACAKLGRNFYGIEKDEEYLDEATRRIELAQQQMSMRMY